MEGLSPQARGNQGSRAMRALGLGTIPAGAGEPASSCASCRRREDYPRRRGGTKRDCSVEYKPQGLSPQARGNRRGKSCRAERSWTIPAGAGEPISLRNSLNLCQDYPRRRGGTTPTNGWSAPRGGLSPQARGNRSPALPAAPGSRTIPAGAGEPVASSGRHRRGGDYPRRRGGTRTIENCSNCL